MRQNTISCSSNYGQCTHHKRKENSENTQTSHGFPPFRYFLRFKTFALLISHWRLLLALLLLSYFHFIFKVSRYLFSTRRDIIGISRNENKTHHLHLQLCNLGLGDGTKRREQHRFSSDGWIFLSHGSVSQVSPSPMDRGSRLTVSVVCRYPLALDGCLTLHYRTRTTNGLHMGWLTTDRVSRRAGAEPDPTHIQPYT